MVKSIKSLIWAAKIFGSTAFTIDSKNNNVCLSKFGLVYSAVMTISILSIGVIQFLLDDYHTLNTKSLFLTMTRTCLGCSCFIADIIISIVKSEHLISALDHLRMYDLAVKMDKKIHYPTVIRYRIAVVIILLCWILVGYTAYKVDNDYPLLEIIAYLIFYGGMATQILFFFGIMLLLYRRFDHLNQIILRKEWMGMKIKVVSKTLDSFKIQDVWWMHSNLATAAEKINNVYSIQLLLWIFTFSVNVLSRAYTFFNYQDNTQFITARDVLCAVGVFVNLIIIILSCHMTSRRANQVVDKVFSPTSVIQRNSNVLQENNAATVYFCVRKVYFTAAAGFINIHLPLLLSIVTAMTTYLVIIHKSTLSEV